MTKQGSKLVQTASQKPPEEDKVELQEETAGPQQASYCVVVDLVSSQLDVQIEKIMFSLDFWPTRQRRRQTWCNKETKTAASPTPVGSHPAKPELVGLVGSSVTSTLFPSSSCRIFSSLMIQNTVQSFHGPCQVRGFAFVPLICPMKQICCR